MNIENSRSNLGGSKKQFQITGSSQKPFDDNRVSVKDQRVNDGPISAQRFREMQSNALKSCLKG